MDLFALADAIHAYNHILLNQKSLKFKYFCCYIFITIFSYFIFKCTQFGRKWLSPLCDELSSLSQQEKGFSSKEAIFLDFPANPNNEWQNPTDFVIVMYSMSYLADKNDRNLSFYSNYFRPKICFVVIL